MYKLIVVLLLSVLSFVSQSESVKNQALIGLNETKNTQFNALKGNYVYVDFWASWCGPCRKSFPFMVELQSRFKNENFKIAAISVDEDKADALSFLASNNINFPVYLDVKGTIATQFNLPGMPTSYLIDPQGNIISKHVGFNQQSQDEIFKELTTLFKK